MVGIFDPACEVLPPWTKEIYFTSVLLPLYLLFDQPPEFYTLFLTRFRAYKIALSPPTKMTNKDEI
jgi:hypothetical protein